MCWKSLNKAKPVIGIAATLIDPPADNAFSPIRREITNEAYIASLVDAGAIPILLPTVYTEAEALLDLCDGLLLPGGFDIDPLHYGQQQSKLSQDIVPKTDMFQLALLRLALARHLPILGICRGCQLINIHCGGTLYQDLSEAGPKALVHSQTKENSSHRVYLQEGTLLCQIFSLPSLFTNSFHHQGINSLGNDLVASALCSDGFIEAIEHKTQKWCIGVQWHPEAMMMSSNSMLPLFNAFIEACKES